jgi:peroxiredoxin
VGIAWQGNQAEIDEFVQRHGLSFPNVLDADGSIFAGFGVASQPAWVFQDAGGNRERVSGAMPTAEIETRLTAIAEEA